MSRTDAEFIKIGIEKLKTYQKLKDPEKAHRRADRVLIHILRRLQLHHVVNEYKKIEKWYS